MTSETDHQDTAPDEGLPLPGLDGSSPLGFLAALGVLRAMNAVHSTTKLAWTETGGSWRPIVQAPGMSPSTFVSTLNDGLKSLDGEPWKLNSKFPFEASALETATIEAIQTGSRSTRSGLDLLAGFGVSALLDDKGNFEGTAFQMVRSGDSQGNGLSGYAGKLSDETTEEQIHTALFETWTFDEPGCALRWSPEENVGYALQWDNPGGQPATSIRGANRLAIEALGILSVVPIKREARTTAFSGRRQQFLTWPIWTVPVSLNVARSLISMDEIHSREVNPIAISPRGISAIFRCERIKTSTYYHNFSPSRRIA